MNQNEHFIQLLAEQIKDFDSRKEAIEAAAEDTDIQFLLSYVASNQPELLDRFSLWDLLKNKESWKEQVQPGVSLSEDGSLKVTTSFSD